MIPREVGHGRTIDSELKSGRPQGVWATLLAARRPLERRRQGRLAEPSAGRVDAQRIKSAKQHHEIGLDGATPVKGRQRPLWVDPWGLMVAVVVTSAHPDDRVGLMTWMTHDVAHGVTRRRKGWGDQGDRGQALKNWV